MSLLRFFFILPSLTVKDHHFVFRETREHLESKREKGGKKDKEGEKRKNEEKMKTSPVFFSLSLVTVYLANDRVCLNPWHGRREHLSFQCVPAEAGDSS